DGSALGAGADLVAACDCRIAAPATRFRMPGLRFGIVLGTRRLAALVGADAAHEILMTSRSFEAAEAERLGFVQRLAEPGAWPEIVRGIVDAQRLDGPATVHLKAHVKPDMRASDMAALVDSAAAPGLKDRIRAFRSAENSLLVRRDPAEQRAKTGARCEAGDRVNGLQRAKRGR